MSVASEITAARGDGIGPEIMDASIRILREAGAKLDIDWIEVGKSVYEQGHSAGIEPHAWDSLRRTKVLFKAPITTPQGGGYKSLNVTLRKTLGLYANVRPCVSYHPFVRTKHPVMDVVIVRENEEDLYAGIEHRQSVDVCQSLKLISAPGCERICRAAFDYARANDRHRVTAMVKDNIMKLTDGLFHRVFKQVAQDYPEIEADSMIIDIGAARLADTPERFDVIVTLNLYGDIISDIAAQIAGSVGLAGSSNIGDDYSMFEAIHGSAPDIAGKGIANPSGLLLGGVMMLVHLGQTQAAEAVHNAWLRTIEDGVHTADIFTRGVSAARVNAEEFTDAVVDRLGLRPEKLPPVSYSDNAPTTRTALTLTARSTETKDLVGVDLFVGWQGSADALAERLKRLEDSGLTLRMISNRGQKVWPEGFGETFCVDHWRCRFLAEAPVEGMAVAGLHVAAIEAGLEILKSENLFTFDGEPGFSKGQGE
jgi:isocitrate dehydrogenase